MIGTSDIGISHSDRSHKSCLSKQPARKMEVGPSAPPMMEIHILTIESKEDCKEVSHVDTKLCCSTHQEALRVRDQRTEVCHRTYTHEDKGWKNTPLIKDIEIMKKTTNTVGHVFRIRHNVRININKEHTKMQ